MNILIILCIFLVIFYFWECREKFDQTNISSENKSNKKLGLYNYFYQSYMNPYQLSLNKFYSSDKEKLI